MHYMHYYKNNSKMRYILMRFATLMVNICINRQKLS